MLITQVIVYTTKSWHPEWVGQKLAEENGLMKYNTKEWTLESREEMRASRIKAEQRKEKKGKLTDGRFFL